MSEVRTVSLKSEHWAFVKSKGYSLSRILQAAINQRMSGEESYDFYKNRCTILAGKLTDVMNFLKKEGLEDVFYEWDANKDKRIRAAKQKSIGRN